MEPEPPEAAFFCLEAEPEPTQEGRSRLLQPLYSLPLQLFFLYGQSLLRSLLIPVLSLMATTCSPLEGK